MSPGALIGGGLGVAASVAGAAALRRAWRRANPARPMWIGGGWLLSSLGVVAWFAAAGADKAVASGLLVASLAGYGLVALSLQRRTGKRIKPSRDRPLEPARQPVRFSRALCALPLSAAAGLGVGVLIAVRAPLSDIDRLILAGLATPLVWALALTWSLIAARLTRVGLFLAGLVALTAGLSAWPA